MDDTILMVYVERGPDGAVKGVYRCKQPGYAEEQLPADHPDVVAFEQMVTQMLATNNNIATTAQGGSCTASAGTSPAQPASSS